AAAFAFLGAHQPGDSRVSTQLRCGDAWRKVYSGRRREHRALGGSYPRLPGRRAGGSGLNNNPEKLSMMAGWLSMIRDYSLWRDVLMLVSAVPLVYYVIAIVMALRFFGGEQGKCCEESIPPERLLNPLYCMGYVRFDLLV